MTSEKGGIGRMECESKLAPVKITIIGAGVSGRALARFAASQGADVFVSESRENLSADVVKEFENNGIGWETGGHSERAWLTDKVVVSSGIPPLSYPVREAQRRGLSLVGEIDFLAPYLRGKIIGITGSNGKTTTTALIGCLLAHCGYNVAVSGNIGIPLADFAGKDYDFIVVELSSFQLFWTEKFKVDVAVLTNLAPDHINWHGSYENYVAAKKKLLSLQDSENWAIIQLKDFKSLCSEKKQNIISLCWRDDDDYLSKRNLGRRIIMDNNAAYIESEKREECLFQYEETCLIGRHNMENVAMAMAVTYILGICPESLKEGLTCFHALPHRCQFVTELDGIQFVDDSKGTNVAASCSALQSLKGEKVVILGGQGKGEDYAPLAETVVNEARVSIILGEEKDKIAEALYRAGMKEVHLVEDLSMGVRLAAKLAHKGEIVLLSPACTSWDMYPSYKKRGEHFIRLVGDLKKERE